MHSTRQRMSELPARGGDWEAGRQAGGHVTLMSTCHRVKVLPMPPQAAMQPRCALFLRPWLHPALSRFIPQCLPCIDAGCIAVFLYIAVGSVFLAGWRSEVRELQGSCWQYCTVWQCIARQCVSGERSRYSVGGCGCALLAMCGVACFMLRAHIYMRVHLAAGP